MKEIVKENWALIAVALIYVILAVIFKLTM